MKAISPESEIIQGIVENARLNLEKEGELMPVFFLSKEEKLAIIGAPFSNNEEKEQAVNAVKQACSRMEADWVLGVNEAWMVKLEKKDNEPDPDISKITPSKHPERIEVVMFNLQVRGGKTYWASVEQILKSDGSKTFGEVEMKPMEESMQGLFTDLLGETGPEGMARFTG